MSGLAVPDGQAASARATARGARRRAAIVAAAAELFARHGYQSVGIDQIGAAAGITGPGIYRHFGSKAALLAAVIDGIIDAVSRSDPSADLVGHVAHYARAVAQHRELMAVFVREVHHLPDEHAETLRRRQRELVARWCTLLAVVHPSWPAERVRTAVHAVFGMLNAVGTFVSPLPDAQLADELARLAVAALELAGPSRRGTGQNDR